MTNARGARSGLSLCVNPWNCHVLVRSKTLAFASGPHGKPVCQSGMAGCERAVSRRRRQ